MDLAALVCQRQSFAFAHQESAVGDDGSNLPASCRLEAAQRTESVANAHAIKYTWRWSHAPKSQSISIQTQHHIQHSTIRWSTYVLLGLHNCLHQALAWHRYAFTTVQENSVLTCPLLLTHIV